MRLGKNTICPLTISSQNNIITQIKPDDLVVIISFSNNNFQTYRFLKIEVFIYVHYVIKVWCTEKCKLERTDLTKSQTSAETNKQTNKQKKQHPHAFAPGLTGCP